MNHKQIEYFLTVARVLNMTKAAQALYLSQPALSKQITAMESELNMQLFIRDGRGMRLTPAGTVLAQRLPALVKQYKEIVENAATVNLGHSGRLTIGTLESQWASRTFALAYQRFSGRYPNIAVKLVEASFGELRRMLDLGEIDIAITLEYDVEQEERYLLHRLEKSRAVLVISAHHPLAQKPTLTMADLEALPFIQISQEDSPHSAQLLEREFHKHGINPNRRIAPNLSTAMLWVDAGLGVGVANAYSPITQNQNIRVLQELPLGEANVCMAWQRLHRNPAVALFTELCMADAQPPRGGE